MKKLIVMTLACATLAGCGSNAKIKEEISAGCMRGAFATKEYCDCTTDYVLSKLDSKDVAMLGTIADMPKDASDTEIADALGMTKPELRSRMQSLFRDMSSISVEAGNSCKSKL